MFIDLRVIRAGYNTICCFAFLLRAVGEVRVEDDGVSNRILQDWTYALGPVTPDVEWKDTFGCLGIR